MTLIDGKATAAAIKQEIAEEVKQMLAAGKRAPHLAAILVGHDGGSETYVKNKVLACEACGFESTLLRFEDDITEAELLSHVQSLNENPAVDGFIVQLPLPKHIDEQRVGKALPDLQGSLHLDLEQHILTLCELFLDKGARRAVTVAAVLCMLQKTVMSRQLLKILHGRKKIRDAVDLALTRCARCLGNGQDIIVMPLQKLSDQCSLACSGKTGDHR